MLLMPDGGYWLLSGLVAFAVFQAVYGIAIRAWSRPQPGARMLLLRVFALGKQSQHLFDTVVRVWRYAGSVRLIAGPDLARSTVEPYRFLDFVSGRLKSRFIDSPQALDREIAAINDRADSSGRFRTNEFLCRDNTWKNVLARLAVSNDAVLMDVRGFSHSNAGCRYELHALVDYVALGRVVFLSDRGAAGFVEQEMRLAWQTIAADSPNRKAGSGRPSVVFGDTVGWRETDQLLRALCSAAGQAVDPERIPPASQARNLQ